MCLHFQAPHAPDGGQLGAHWEDVPQPVGGVIEQGMPQDPLNVPHHGMGGHYPPMLGVSDFGLSSVLRPSLTNDTRSTGPCGCSGPVRIPQCRVCPRHSSTRTSQWSSKLQFRFPIHMLNQTLWCRGIEDITFLAFPLSMSYQILPRLPSILTN